MNIAVRKRFILSPLATLVLGLSAAGACSMVLADTSSAAAPAGVGCQASDGKINGRGSTYQNVLQKEYIKVYGEDFCGSVAEQFSGDPAGTTMVAYNYPAAVSASATGSGNGIKSANCRTDAFGGTDTPYSRTQFTELNEGPGTAGIGGCSISFTPPFTPNSSPFPNANDVAAPVMALPIGGSSVTVAVHLGTTTCSGTAPTSLKFTPKEVSRLYGGDVATWNDAELVKENPALETAKCTGPVTRVVRFDSSGTTNILKQYMIRVDNERLGATCLGEGGTLHNWEAYFATNTEWPGKQHPGSEGTCSAITTGAASGGPELIAKLKTVEGGIGYIDLAEALGQPGVVLASVQNATGTKFESPGTGQANCLFSALPAPPGSTNNDAVGLNAEDNWSNNNEGYAAKPANHENATDLGSKYPICGLTFDLVYSGLHENNGEGKGANSRLTADQRRTLYSFFTFILSSAGQEVPARIHYAPLPSSWLTKLAQGFHENF